MKKLFRNVAVGGTFDELHDGHIALLSKAFEVGEHVFIGLTSDEFVVRLCKPHKVASFSERLVVLNCFLEKPEFRNRFSVSSLDTSYGLAASKVDLDALIVSQETVKVGKAINKVRVEAGLPLLSVVVIDLVPAENMKPISTTCIRANEMDRNGHLLKHKL
ncbi:MAG: pantetheine-phosphate adenylyltransferase [Nitrososphaerota archaeon]|nr:pantetheine-phosphate adenylyltransferase [Nitrososphaerota archaeon]